MNLKPVHCNEENGRGRGEGMMGKEDIQSRGDREGTEKQWEVGNDAVTLAPPGELKCCDKW